MKKNIEGQSLFEVILALGISTLILVALVALVTNSVRNSNFSRNKTYATRYNQEALEWIRGQRDDNWDTFNTNALVCGVPPYEQCLDVLEWGDCGECSDSEVIDDVFKREISFSDVAADSMTILLRTYWTDAQGVHEVRSSTILTDWRAIY